MASVTTALTWVALALAAYFLLTHGRYEGLTGLTDHQQQVIDTEVFKKYKFFGRPRCSPGMKSTGKYNYKVCKQRQRKYDVQAKRILKKWISWNKNRKAAAQGCNSDGLSNKQADELIVALKDGKCYQDPKKGFWNNLGGLSKIKGPVTFPSCTCKDGAWKNSHGVPVCGGGGSCA